MVRARGAMVIGVILVCTLLLTAPVASGRVTSYKVKGMASGSGPTNVEYKVTWRCSEGDKNFGVHLWLYSFETGATIWDKKMKGTVRNGSGAGSKTVGLNLRPGQYLIASSNALCWADSQSQGAGPRGLRCWNTFEVTRTRVIGGESFNGEDCTDI